MNSDHTDSASEPPAVQVPAQKFPGSLLEQIKLVLFHSKEFFSAMPTAGGYVQPAIFLAVTTVIHAVPVALMHGKPFEILSGFLSGFLLYLLLSGLLFVLAKTFGGVGTFESTFRVTAYSSAPKVITWLPYVGWLAGIYAIYLQILGVEAVHKLSRGKAVAVVAVPVAISLVLWLVATLVGRLITHGH